MNPTPGLDGATQAVEDAFYVTVGAGVLAVQSAQVRRRELQARLADHLGDAHVALDRLRSGADDGLRVVDHQVGEVLDQVGDRLPGGARDLIDRSRTAVLDRLSVTSTTGDDEAI